MNRVLASWMAALVASALLLPSPAIADFKLSKKPKPAAAAPAPRQRPARVPRAPRTPEPEPAPMPPVPQITGIDPALMQETVTEANYTAKLVRDLEAKTAVLQVTDGKSGWSVNFSDCAEENQCKSMEFYTLWRTPNEANVCQVWGSDVTQDPNRTAGKPFCYTVPSLSRQFHLKLSSDQAPYVGMDKLPVPQAKERMSGMIGIWSQHLGMLPEAWKIARSKCPKAADKCT